MCSCLSRKHLPFPYKALRDEGTSYHYAPPLRYIEVSEKARKAIEKMILAHGMKYQEVVTWSTDGFYRETKEKAAYRKSEGCSIVEMECSALTACAAFRGAVWGMILYTADSLADAEKYDERNWGENAYEYALTLCLDTVLRLLLKRILFWKRRQGYAKEMLKIASPFCKEIELPKVLITCTVGNIEIRSEKTISVFREDILSKGF